jgi:hypothetical protein
MVIRSIGAPQIWVASAACRPSARAARGVSARLTESGLYWKITVRDSGDVGSTATMALRSTRGLPGKLPIPPGSAVGVTSLSTASRARRICRVRPALISYERGRAPIPPPILLRLPGGFRFSCGGQSLELPVGPQRVVAVAALRGRLSRSRLAGTVWPETTEHRALASLRTAIWRVNRIAYPLAAGT